MAKTSVSTQIQNLKNKTHEIRKQVLKMCIKAGTGHVTSSMSCVEILVALYYGGKFRCRPANPEWEDRDRFILSKGQASPLLYAVLGDLGFFPKDELDKFCQADGIFGVHLQNDVPGVEITAGSLGHGLGIASGMALAAKMDKKAHRVFTLLGDGECYEGSVWEAAMFAAHHQLDNLVAIIDRNRLCVTDFTEKIVRLDPIDEKFMAFGWEVMTVDGHSMEHILSGLEKFNSGNLGKPLAIIANTVKGKGIPFMENIPLWHGLAPQGKEAEQAMAELDKASGK